MSERKLTVDDIEVPEGMINAVINAGAWKMATIQALLENALLWLAENPSVPSEEEAREIYHAWPDSHSRSLLHLVADWQRRMFLRKEDALPDEVKKLMYQGGREPSVTHNEAVSAAYRLGKEGK